jgi:hypothetical protein
MSLIIMLHFSVLLQLVLEFTLSVLFTVHHATTSG